MKKNKTFFWVATSIIILWEGIIPLATVLFAPDQVTVGTQALGYPDYFTYALIICKIIGVVAISVPALPVKLKEWAYAGLFFNLLFALISHACVNQNFIFMLLPIVVMGILSISYIHNKAFEKQDAE